MNEYYIKENLPDGSYVFTRTENPNVSIFRSSKTPPRSFPVEERSPSSWRTPRTVKTPLRDLTSEEVDLLTVPEFNENFNLRIPTVRDENIIPFYVDLYSRNMYAVVVQDEDAADNFIRSVGAFELQRDSARLIHYLQLSLQPDEIVYWGSNSPLIKINMNDPVKGKITYKVVKKDSKFFAIVILSN